MYEIVSELKHSDWMVGNLIFWHQILNQQTDEIPFWLSIDAFRVYRTGKSE
jgi:hypothetical protein